MTIIPDTKNWTWALSRPCPECGFDASTFPCQSVAGELRQSGAAWRALFMRPDALETAGGALADRFDQVGPDDWPRPGRRSDGASFTIDSLSRYLLHDVVHHLHDVAPGGGQGDRWSAPSKA